MRLKDYPIIFDETELFRPEKWEESKETIENTNVTEAGTDSVEIIRKGKRHISCEFACTDEWTAIFEEFYEQDEISVKYYGRKERGYVSVNMYMDNFKVGTEIHSDYVTQSIGLYSVTFDLIEF